MRQVPVRHQTQNNSEAPPGSHDTSLITGDTFEMCLLFCCQKCQLGEEKLLVSRALSFPRSLLLLLVRVGPTRSHSHSSLSLSLPSLLHPSLFFCVLCSNTCQAKKPGLSDEGPREGRGGGFLEREETVQYKQSRYADDGDKYDDMGE